MNVAPHQGQCCKLPSPGGSFADWEAGGTRVPWREGWGLGAGDSVGVGRGKKPPSLACSLSFSERASQAVRVWQVGGFALLCAWNALFHMVTYSGDFRATPSGASNVKHPVATAGWRQPPSSVLPRFWAPLGRALLSLARVTSLLASSPARCRTARLPSLCLLARHLARGLFPGSW